MPPTYAILGATGQTGGSILQVLASERPDVDINCLVRSRPKLERMYPDIVGAKQKQKKKQQPSSSSSSSSSSQMVKVFEGQISDIPLLTDCIRGTSAVFLCVASPNNKPHIRIARDQAEAVVAALDALREEEQQQQQQQQQQQHQQPPPAAEEAPRRGPLLVVLSSAETDEARFCGGIPWAARRLLFAANWWLYADLIAAERYLRARSGRVDAVFVKPGGISTDARRGHVLSAAGSQTFVSFLDVAGGMVQCADEGAARWAGGSVSVLSDGKARVEWASGPLLLRNMLCTWIPWLYPWLF